MAELSSSNNLLVDKISDLERELAQIRQVSVANDSQVAKQLQ